jgi:hypothetical protein
MSNDPIESPAEADVRFQGYRLEVISQWPPSARKVAVAEAISQRLTSIARSALVRPDIANLLHFSCELLDGFFAADDGQRAQHDPLDEETVREVVDVY